MRALGATLLVVSLLGVAGSAEAQGAAELFGKVASTVVVVRAKDAGVDGQGRVSDIGSGVVVSGDGKIMTAAHLVHGAEGIGVQFLGGRTRWAPSTVYKAIPLAEFFQTDASINVGNSGGPMFNRGER